MSEANNKQPFDPFEDVSITIYIDGTTTPLMMRNGIKTGNITNQEQYAKLLNNINSAFDQLEITGHERS